MTTNTPLLPGNTYHIYNRGNNRDPLFFENRNYSYFLKLYAQYIHPIAETYAYCLLRNHFHFLLRIKTDDERLGQSLKPASRYFNNMFIAYTKAINTAYNHTGSMFESPFRRKLVDSDSYFTTLILYIHQNPQNHHCIEDFRDWPWSSYRALASDGPTRLQRDWVLATFGGLEAFVQGHQKDVAADIAIDWG